MIFFAVSEQFSLMICLEIKISFHFYELYFTDWREGGIKENHVNKNIQPQKFIQVE